MIKFKRLNGEGFGSLIKPFKFNFQQGTGLVIIKGENGVGKTTIFSLLTWVLYGTLIKGKDTSVETWEYLRGEDWAGTMGDVTFYKGSDKIQVIRCSSYNRKVGKTKGGNKLFLKINNELYPNGKVETNKKIQEILGKSYTVFKSSVIFGQKVKRLIEESGPDKKKLLEEAFNLSFITRAKKQADEDITILNTEISIAETEVEKAKEQIKIQRILRTELRESLESLRSAKSESEKYQEAYVIKQRQILKKLQKQVNTKNLYNLKIERKAKLKLKAELGNLDVLIHNLGKFELLIKQATIDKKKKVNEKERFKETAICNSCGQKIPKKDMQRHIKHFDEDLAEIRNNKKLVLNNILEHKKKIRKLRVINNIIIDLDSKIEILEAAETAYENQKKFVKTVTQKPDSSGKVHTEKIEKQVEQANLRISEEKRNKQKTYAELTILKRQYDLKLWLSRSPLSNSGLKSFMFNYFLDQLNALLIKYSDIVPHIPQLTIDFESAHKNIVTKIFYQGVEIPNIADLSGGQNQLCNALIAFAAHDIIANDINLLLLDEIFESLSISNIDIISEIITEKAKHKLIYLVTHRDEFSPLNTKTINLSLVNNNTAQA